MVVSRLNKLYQEEMLDSWATVNHLRELTWNAIWCIVFINALMPLVYVSRSLSSWTGASGLHAHDR